MDGGAWWAAVHGVAEGWTRLSNFTFPFHFHALEKEMATHSSVLAWRIPGTGEAGRLLSMGSHRVGHDWSDLAAAVPSSSSHGKTSFFFMAEQYSYSIVYISHIFFIHSSVDGHLGWFRILDLLNNAAMNIGVHVYFQINVLFSSDVYPGVWLLNYTVVLFLVFRGISIQLYIVVAGQGFCFSW